MVESLATLRETAKLKDEKVARMGAMEQVTAEGDEADGNDKKGEAMMANTMRRATSVDDLFAPMWQLNVQSSSTAPSASHQSACSVASSSSARVPVTAPASSAPHAARIAEGGASSSVPPAHHKEAGPNGPVSPRPANNSLSGSLPCERETKKVAADAKVQQYSKKQDDGLKRTGRDRPLEGSSSSHSSEPDPADVKPSFTASETDHHLSTAKNERKGTTGKANSGDVADPLPPSNSTSDEDQHTGGIDERKQKRMLSNRESARRSRLRKQQHLDELRAQVARLRADNNDMMTKFSIASQRYDYLMKENRELRSHAMSLTSQLQRLHHTAAQHPGGLRALGLQPGHLDPAPFGTMSSIHHSPYSMVPDMLQ